MNSAEAFNGSRVIATDGMIGRVVDLLFDEEKWIVRYLVVNAGDWLPRRQVLISPHSVRFVDGGSRLVIAGLTRHKVAGSPPMDPRTPITRQQEWDHCAYFGYSAYWPGGGAHRSWGGIPDQKADHRRRTPGSADEACSPMRAAADAGLHSCREINGFLVRGQAEQLGRVDDLQFNEATWAIQLIVVAAGRWLDGRRIEITPARLRSVNWNERCLVAGLGRADIRHSRLRYQAASSRS